MPRQHANISRGWHNGSFATSIECDIDTGTFVGGRMNALLIFLLCFAFGHSCKFVESAHVTTYSPELGGINCQEPCNLTGYLQPLQYGVGAACGLDIPYNTRVYIEGVGWRVCNDHGGGIDNNEVDILTEEYPSWMAGMRDTVWLLDSP